jgi:hypothetical protein
MSRPERSDYCGNCLAFDQASPRAVAQNVALCRKGPPIRLPRAFSSEAEPGNRRRDEKIVWGWGEVDPSDWCLDHVRKA